MTLIVGGRKSNGKVLAHSNLSNFYARWRERRLLRPSLREESSEPPERLLQLIWFHQRLKRDELVTLDGKPVRVLHPGFWNRESGPDFRDAVLQVGSDAVKTCDVEIDLNSTFWRAHHHDRNPAFGNVLLHVIWDGTERAACPTLMLKPCLDAPLAELALWLGSDGASSFPEELRGTCCAPLRELSEIQLRELLQQAALVRLQSKAAHFQARARQAGWDQALWEGLFRALGYKHNVWPMQRLAELRAQLAPTPEQLGPMALQARLFGASGLLPDEVGNKAASYVRELWDFWWRDREALSDCQLPREVWRFHGLRPANHPQRRLALAAHWLASDDLPGRLQHWASKTIADRDLHETLLRILQVRDDGFWSWHWTVRSKRLAKPQPLLGPARVTDLAVNVVLPWLWRRAADGKNETLRAEMERRYLVWPMAEDNSVLRLARQRLLGRSSPGVLNSAALQQGLLQIVRDFCEHSNAICQDCQFPDLVKQWKCEVTRKPE